jgi:hypothetical protein
MPDEVRRRIYEEGGHDFSADICQGATLADLDKDAIANFRQRWFQRSGLKCVLPRLLAKGNVKSARWFIN